MHLTVRKLTPCSVRTKRHISQSSPKFYTTNGHAMAHLLKENTTDHIGKLNLLKQIKEKIIAVCSANHIKLLCSQNVELFKVTAGVNVKRYCGRTWLNPSVRGREGNRDFHNVKTNFFIIQNKRKLGEAAGKQRPNRSLHSQYQAASKQGKKRRRWHLINIDTRTQGGGTECKWLVALFL